MSVRARSRDARRAVGAALRTLPWVVGIVSYLFGAAGGAQGRAAPEQAPRPRAASVKDSPGYVPLVDPESTSVVIGRRLNAPLVSKRFKGGAKSLDALGRAVCRALHRGDGDSLMMLCIRDDEFRDILWREFPQSRPAVGLAWEDGWRVLVVRLNAGCSEAMREYGGHHYELLRVETDSIAAYRNFKLYSGLTLVARDDEGRIQRMKWLRSAVERKGVFKIYSTED